MSIFKNENKDIFRQTKTRIQEPLNDPTEEKKYIFQKEYLKWK